MEQDQNRIDDEKKLSNTNNVGDEAFGMFLAQLEASVKDYVGAAEASDAVFRACRVSNALEAMLEHVRGFARQHTTLN